MGHNIELNQISVIQQALPSYEGFTRGEKKYCMENLSQWMTNEKGLDTLISKLDEKSLDVRPFLKRLGLVG
jgi:hypothetical protein